VLEALALYFHRGEHQTVAHKVGRVADAFAVFEAATQLQVSKTKESEPKTKHPPVEIGFFSFDVDRVDRVEAEPGGKGESVFVRPPREGRKDDGLKNNHLVDMERQGERHSRILCAPGS